MKSWWICFCLALVAVSANAGAEMLSVKVNRANFREGPATSAAILYTADKYFAVKVLERQKDWVKTQDFEGDTAWVAAHLLDTTSSVVVHVASALVRESPDKHAPVIFKADRGEGMMVHSQKGAWLQVSNVDERKGWVHRDVVWGEIQP